VNSSTPSLVWAFLMHENGALSSVQSTYLLPEEVPDATSDRIDVYGSEGSAFVDYSASSGDGRREQREDLDAALVKELEHFARCVEAEQPSEIVPLQDSVHGVGVAAAIVQSAANDGAEVLL
jgi:predicted dehydrogenase